MFPDGVRKPGRTVRPAAAEEAATAATTTATAIEMSAFGKPRYVPAEQVGEITEGTVRLDLTREQVDQLSEYLEPATTAEIESDGKGGFGETVRADARELEGKVFAPTQKREHS